MTELHLSESVIRASWEPHRQSMVDFLIREKKFNPKSAPKAVDNFIKSMVFAGIPNASEAGIKGAWQRFKAEGSVTPAPRGEE